MNRREFVVAGTATAVAAGSFFREELFAAPAGATYSRINKHLDKFVETYLRAMNAPGLTLVLADRDGVQRVVTYGFSDPALKVRVKPDELFQIGSISKSFLAIALLQLRQEGKLDLQKPILEYLPWFAMESAFEPVTVHHLLTHTSGLPGIPNVYLSDSAARHRAAYAPGKLFHYNNMAFALLGELLETLDGKELPEIFRERIFEPLGMTESEPVITLDSRTRTAKNFCPFQSDRPYARFGKLCEAPAIVLTEASGCVAATPQDMGLYVQMIARHGVGPKSRILNEENFGLFSHAHVKAEEFGPTASYGYGIAVDTLDGHKIVRHTGGMISFASALHVDIDEGVGAFASINAMQGYRPNAVAQYAIQLMRAERAKKSLPVATEIAPATRVENAAQYAGMFASANGKKVEFAADNHQLFLVRGGQRFVLEAQGGDVFLAAHPEFERFLLVFGRADGKDPKSAVVEVGWGGDWYVNAGYNGPKTFESPKEWDAYLGHYRNENNWVGSMRIVKRKGTLLVDGVVPLEPQKDGSFRMADEESNTEWIRFFNVVNGRAMRIKLSGEDLWRVAAP